MINDFYGTLRIYLKEYLDDSFEHIKFVDPENNNKASKEPIIRFTDEGWARTQLLIEITNQEDSVQKNGNVTYHSSYFSTSTRFNLLAKKIKNFELVIENSNKTFEIQKNYQQKDFNDFITFLVNDLNNFYKNALDNWLNNKKIIGFEIYDKK